MRIGPAGTEGIRPCGTGTTHRPAGRSRSPRARHEFDSRLSGSQIMIAPMLPARFLAASCLDWIAGDPHGMPHPVRLMGRAISTGERWLRRPDSPANEMLSGAALTGTRVGGSWVVPQITVGAGGAVGEILLAWITTATRSFLD